MGAFNYWTVADAAYEMTLVGDYYVYEGLVLAEDSELKFNAGGWGNNRGGDGFAVGEPISVWHDGSNIKVPAGTYDVYLNYEENTAYFMEEGMVP